MPIIEQIIIVNFVVNLIFGGLTILFALKTIRLSRENTRLNRINTALNEENTRLNRTNTALNEENTRLNRINTDLNEVALAPHLNIMLSDIYAPSKGKGINMTINVDNSGEGVANFPKCYWKIIINNEEEHSSGEMLDFPLYGGKSYIEPHSITIPSTYPLGLPKEKIKEPFKIVKIWFRYKDGRNREWLSYADFGRDEKGRLITITETIVYLRQKSKKWTNTN